MSGSSTHIEVAAYHEAGHALAALKIGCYVERVSVDRRLPGNGVTFHKARARNPFDAYRHPMLAWQYSRQTTLDSMFLSLAGPVAEARLLHTPIRHLGSQSDYQKCLYIANRLEAFSNFFGDFTDPPHVDAQLMLDEMRQKTQRWVRRPRVWNFITAIANGLIEHGSLDGDRLTAVIGHAKSAGQLSLNHPSQPAARRPRRSTHGRRQDEGKIISAAL